MALDTPRSADPPRRPAAKAVAVFVVFTLAGPPLAALIFGLWPLCLANAVPKAPERQPTPMGGP